MIICAAEFSASGSRRLKFSNLPLGAYCSSCSRAPSLSRPLLSANRAIRETSILSARTTTLFAGFRDAKKLNGDQRKSCQESPKFDNDSSQLSSTDCLASPAVPDMSRSDKESEALLSSARVSSSSLEVNSLNSPFSKVNQKLPPPNNSSILKSSNTCR